MRRHHIERFSRLAVLATMLGCVSEAKTAGSVCIAPANPGGGWDFSCRAVAEALGTHAPGGQAIRATNIPGEGGGVAFKHVVETRAGGDPVLVAAGPSTLLGLAQHHYGDHTEHDVRWIAAVDAEPSIIAVSAKAPWHSLREFVTYWRAHPDSIVIGGTSYVGGQDHMKMLLLARAAGIDVRRVRYRSVNAASEAVSLVTSGELQVFPAELSKMLPAVRKKELRVLAVLGEYRSPGLLASVPTAREEGFDLVFVIWRGFYAPAHTSDALYNQWVETLRTMTDSPEWRSTLERNGLTPFFLGGKEFEAFVSERTAAYRNISKDIGIIQ